VRLSQGIAVKNPVEIVHLGYSSSDLSRVRLLAVDHPITFSVLFEQQAMS
jgi:hypothetical protein